MPQRCGARRRFSGREEPVTEPFGKQCLLARRLVERGVRFVQLYSGAKRRTNIDDWDAHSNLAENHRGHAREVDKRPPAGANTLAVSDVQSVLSDLASQVVRQRIQVPVGLTGRHDQVVGVGADAFDIDQDDVGRKAV